MSADRSFWVYILASKIGGTLYIGVTNDLVRRVYEHKIKVAEGFTRKYDVDRLVYFEQFYDIENAIRREKRIKKWNRAWKIRLIESVNPNWDDLYPAIASTRRQQQAPMSSPVQADDPVLSGVCVYWMPRLRGARRLRPVVNGCRRPCRRAIQYSPTPVFTGCPAFAGHDGCGLWPTAVVARVGGRSSSH